MSLICNWINSWRWINSDAKSVRSSSAIQCCWSNWDNFNTNGYWVICSELVVTKGGMEFVPEVDVIPIAVAFVTLMAFQV